MPKPDLPGHRSEADIKASAAAIDLLLADGVDPLIVQYLLQARQAWWGHLEWPPVSVLMVVLSEPRVRRFDELLWAAVRRRVRLMR